MRRNLTVFTLALSLFFAGLVVLVHYYPSDFIISIEGYNVTNVRAIYLGAAVSFSFFVLSIMMAFMGRSKQRDLIQGTDFNDDFSHYGGCVSGFYHNESSGVMVCLNCGTGLNKDFIACPTCGQQIYHECPDCKEVVPTWYNVCPYCEYDFVFFDIAPAEEADDEEDIVESDQETI